MSDLTKLETMYQKEKALAVAHKDKADELKKRIEEEKGQAILRSVKHLKLTPHDFRKLQKALENEGNVKQLLEKIGGNESRNETAIREETEFKGESGVDEATADKA